MWLKSKVAAKWSTRFCLEENWRAEEHHVRWPTERWLSTFQPADWCIWKPNVCAEKLHLKKKKNAGAVSPKHMLENSKHSETFLDLPSLKSFKAPLHQKHSSWLNQTTRWGVFSFGFGPFYPFSRVNIPENPKNTSDKNDLQHQYLCFLILLSILWWNEYFYHSNLVVSNRIPVFHGAKVK